MWFENQVSKQRKKKYTTLTVIMGLLTRIVCEILAMVFSIAAIVDIVDEDDVIFWALVSAAALRLATNCGRSVGTKYYRNKDITLNGKITFRSFF